MGIYWNNWLYYGRLLSADTYQKLVGKTSLKPGFFTHLYADRIILHAPGKCLRIGWIDPVIEDHEVRKGEISLAEVIQKIRDVPKMWESWNSTTPEQVSQLDELIEQAADGSEAQKFVGTYIVECQYSSYGDSLGDDIRVTKNIRCL